MNNNQKIYFHIDSNPSTDQLFVLLDTVQNGNEDKLDELMNDFDMEFIVPEMIELADNPKNASVLTPEVNVHVVDKGTTHNKELEIKKEENARKKISR